MKLWLSREVVPQILHAIQVFGYGGGMIRKITVVFREF